MTCKQEITLSATLAKPVSFHTAKALLLCSVHHLCDGLMADVP